MDKKNAVYNASVRNTFKYLKAHDNIVYAHVASIASETKDLFLLPLCRGVISSHYSSHPFFEKVRSIVDPSYFNKNDSLIFLVISIYGELLGYFYLDDCENKMQSMNVKSFEFISLDWLRSAIQTLVYWARTTINTDQIKVVLYEWQTGEAAELKTYDFVTVDDRVQEKIMVWAPKKDNVGSELILTAGPSISPKEAVYAYDAAKEGWNRNWSKYLTAFENKFAEYIGVKYAIATSSCTGALQIALMALDIGPGDEVIVPEQTWVATAKAVTYVGATPIFCDIELDTWNVDAASVEKLITKKTKAIIPVHMYGHPARMDAVTAIAKKYKLKLVEDAAPAIGAEWKGERCGSFGDFAGFSFQGAKLMVTGEGGMLVTDNEELYLKALKISDQGRNPEKTFWIDGKGVKFKMSNIQAAVGLAQLERVDELIELKRRIFSWYEEGLKDIPDVYLNKEVEGARSIYWMTSLRLDENVTISRDQLIRSLRQENIDSRPVFPAISRYPIWTKTQSPQPIAKLVGSTAINLPSGVCLSKSEVDYTSEKIRRLLS